MSNTVDNRVVEMKFDNQQFEAGVRQTITSLDNLKEALKFNTSATNLSTLQNSINNFSLSNIEKAVGDLQYRFSTLGIVGASVIQNLTNKAIGLVEHLGRISFGQILTGGKGRAQKVADARFKLGGLLDTAAEVTDVFSAASDAVNDTAFGLDEAANIASMLVGSGVEFKRVADQASDLDTALRGIAGAAAMSNSSFEDIGRIFAQVKTAGRLMGQDMMQLQGRTINVVAELSKYLNKSQAEVQEMVHKGQIDFNTFAAAMDNSFGAQAKKSNETLQGVLANVRSALSRIGEIFYGGIIENKDVIAFFNNLKSAINAVKKAMEPLKEPFKNLVSSISRLGSSILRLFNVEGTFTSFIDKVADGMEALSNWIDTFTKQLDLIFERTHVKEFTKDIVDTTKEAIKITDELRERARAVWQGDYGNGQYRKDVLGEVYEETQAYVNALKAANFDAEKADEIFSQNMVKNAKEVTEAKKESAKATEEAASTQSSYTTAAGNVNRVFYILKTAFSNTLKIVKAAGKAFKKVFSFKDLKRDITNFISSFADFTNHLRITEDRGEKIQDIFAGVFSVFDILRQVISSLITNGLKILGPTLSTLIDIFLNAASKLGRVITKFNEFLKTNDLIYKAGSKVSETFLKISGVLKEFFSRFVELPAVKELRDYFAEFASDVGDSLLTFFGDAKDAVNDFFGAIDDSDTTTMDRVLGGINTVLKKFLKLTKKSKKNIEAAFGWFDKKNKKLDEAGIDISKISTNFEKLKKIGKDLANSKGPMEFLGTLIDSFSEFNGHIGGWVDSIGEVFKKIDFAKIGLIGFAGAITAFTASLSYFTFNAGKFVRELAMIPKAVTGVLSGIKGVFVGIKEYMVNESKAKVIKAYALAIIALAAALIALTFVDQDKLKNAAICLGALMVVMAITVRIISEAAASFGKIVGYNKRLAGFAVLLLAMSVSVLLLAEAMKEMASIKWDKDAWKSLGVLVGLMAALIGVSMLYNKFDLMTDALTLGSFRILIYAAAVWVLVKALAKLEEIDISQLKDKMKVLLEALIAVAIVAKMASSLKIGSALGVLVLIGSVFLIELGLKKLITSGVSMYEILDHLDVFIPVLIVLAMLAGMIFALGKAGKQAEGAVGVILALTLSIMGITYSLRKLAILSMTGHLFPAIIALSLIFVGIIALCKVIGSAEYEFKSVGGTLLKMSAAVAILALVMYGLGKMKPDELYKGLTAVILLSTLLVILARATTLAAKIDGGAFIKMAATVAVLALMVGLLSYIKNKEDLFEAVFALGAILLAFGASMYLATKSVNKSSPKALLAMMGVMAIIAASLVGVLLVSDGDYLKTLAAAASISLILLAFGRVLEILHSFQGSMTQNRLKALDTFIKIILALSVMIAVVGASMAAILYFGNSGGQMIAAAASLAGVIGTITLCLKYMKDADIDPAVAASLLIASVSLIAVAAALAILLDGGYNFEQMAKSAIVLIAVIGAVTLMLAMLGKIASTPQGLLGLSVVAVALVLVLGTLAVTMLAMSYSSLMLVKALKKLTEIPFDKLEPHMKTMLKLVGLFMAIATVLPIAGVGLILIAAAILIVSVSLATLAIAITPLVAVVGKAIDSVKDLLEVLTAMAKDHKQIKMGLTSILNTICQFITNIIIAIAQGIVKAALTLAKNAVHITMALTVLIAAVIKAIGKSIVMINGVILDGIENLLNQLINRLPKIFRKLDKIIRLFGEFLINNVGYFGFLGAYLAVGFLTGAMEGLEAGMHDLTNQAISLIITFVAEMADALVNQGPLMTNAIKSLINAIAYTIMNLLDAITGGWLSSFDGYAKNMQTLADEQAYLAEERARLKAEREMQAEADGIEKESHRVFDKYKAYNQQYTEYGVEQASASGSAISEAQMQSMKQGFEKYGDGVVMAASEVNSNARQQMLNSGNWTQVGEYLVSTTAEGVSSEGSKAELTKSLKDMPEQMKKGLLETGEWTLSEDGKYLINTFTDEFATEETKSKVDGAVDSVLGFLKDHDGEFEDDGYNKAYYWCGGFGNGATDWFQNNKNLLPNLLEDNVVNVTADSLGEESPSKISYGMGEYWIQGMINGLISMKANLAAASNSSLDPLKETMATTTEQLSNLFATDMDVITPTIRPVVDTTNVDQFASQYGTMLDNSASVQMAANSQLSIDSTSQFKMAEEIRLLRADINKMANQDLSKIMDGVQINVNADTNVDGTPLKKMSSQYTIGQINKQEMGYLMATGGRY